MIEQSKKAEKKERNRKNTGQMIRRGERKFLVRIFLGRDATGKKRYFSKLIHGGQKDAQKYLNAALRDKDLGVFVEPASMSLNQYLDKWLESVARPRVSERTGYDYTLLLARNVRPALGERRLSDVRALDVQKLYSTLQTNGLGARFVRYTHSVLSSAFEQAVKWQMLSRNPCDAVELPRMTRREMRPLSPDEARAFLHEANENDHGVLFSLAIDTGMRPSECLALKWSDVDLDCGTATVRRTLLRRKGGGWYFGEPKTAKSRRVIPLTRLSVQKLIIHRRRQNEHRLKFGGLYEKQDRIFATETGTPLEENNVRNRYFKPLLYRAGLPETIRLYDLRHTCATLLLSAGENPKIVSERLGHASVVLTLDTYSHVLPSMQQAATEKLEKLLHIG